MARAASRLLAFRSRISANFYLAVGFAGLVTAIMVFVAWQAFERIAVSQQTIHEKSLPELASVFAISRTSSELVAAAPKLISAQSKEDIGEVSKTISGLRNELERELTVLESLEGESIVEWMARNAIRLTEIVNDVENTMLQLFELRERYGGHLDDLADIETQLRRSLIPVTDDQYFYLVTGRMEIGVPPVDRDIHFTTGELNLYRHLSDLEQQTNIALQLLSSGAVISDRALLKIREELFESSQDAILRSLESIGPLAGEMQLGPLFDQLFSLGTGDDSGFLLRQQELKVLETQSKLIADSRVLSALLVSEAEKLAASVSASAVEAAEETASVINSSRTLMLVLGTTGILGTALIAWLLVGRSLMPRLHYLSHRMREMSQGELDLEVRTAGNDEVADMAAALESFRASALKARRLDVVEELSQNLLNKNSELQSVLDQLQSAQSQIVMQKKLAALGELTAGVAHEIKNPLNFVKNFSEASRELVEEFDEILNDTEMDDKERQEEIASICGMLADNLARILEHGGRAVRIVDDMLRMGRGGGQAQSTNVNQLVEQHAKLAYHGARAAVEGFQIKLSYDFGTDVGEAIIVSQDIGRVVLNLVSNSCYATHQKRLQAETGGNGEKYIPELLVRTTRGDGMIAIRIRDNGSGIPEELLEKIFNPFFTTKPTDQGTGLGLALCSDIVQKHGGSISVETEEGEFAEMTVTLPVDGGEILAASEAENETL
ncbi:MAG: ATP-binding protein [Rhodobacteraceae bacterium]|nr:ATP-binding protein [Paracoccaceae bacterium]